MKKLLLGTAIAIVFATASYGQNASSIPDDMAQTTKALQDGMIEGDTPDPNFPSDLLNGAGGQSALSDPTTALPREKNENENDPEQELLPGAPLPAGVTQAQSSSAQLIESNGDCNWYIVTYLTFADGHNEWRHHYAGLSCNEPPPKIVSVTPPAVTTSACPPLGWTDVTFQPQLEIFTYPDGTVIVCRDLKLTTVIPPAVALPPVDGLNQIIEGNPGESDQLLGGNPETNGTPPALGNPTPKVDNSAPKTMTMSIPQSGMVDRPSGLENKIQPTGSAEKPTQASVTPPGTGDRPKPASIAPPSTGARPLQQAVVTPPGTGDRPALLGTPSRPAPGSQSGASMQVRTVPENSGANRVPVPPTEVKPANAKVTEKEAAAPTTVAHVAHRTTASAPIFRRSFGGGSTFVTRPVAVQHQIAQPQFVERAAVVQQRFEPAPARRR